MLIPKVFFQNAKFIDPLASAFIKADSCINKKRGFTRKTVYDEVTDYISKEIKNFGKILLGEEWLLSRVFTASHHENKHVSYMVGVFPQHDKTTLFIFAREISDIIHLQGFKEEIVDYIVSNLMLKIPKLISQKYRVSQSEDSFIVEKK